MSSGREKWFTWIKLAIDLRSSVIPAIWRRVVATMIFAAIVTVAYYEGFSVNQPIINSLIPTIVLGLLIVFRTNTAYDRYWEGRKLFGSLINNSRILSRNIWFIIPDKTQEQQQEKITQVRLVFSLIVAIKTHLRKEYLNPELSNLLTDQQYLELKNVTHIPLRMINWLAAYFSDLYYQKGLINDRFFDLLNKSLDLIAGDMIGCERILNTPLPKAYSIHLRHLLLIYCLGLPFSYVSDLGWGAIPAVGLVSFALLGVEEIGIEIENPFGRDPNDLPLDDLCKILHGNIEQLIQYGTDVEKTDPTFIYDN
ncbi:bestrophin family protein [Pleurocapsa sp. PCC 7319]|uniref:bestrophin family protein n=1 Tax=Pleurocapsa sp. PCC 7319 TaxID=118161 RepID=UPI000347334A|nr:bestrophin family ion channel [Pleurocapsa sp. PCC 7319]